MSHPRTFLIKLSGTVSGSPVVVWLTSDGSETGRACKTSCPQFSLFIIGKRSGTTSNASNSSPFTEKPLDPIGGGRDFAIGITDVPTSRWQDLQDLLKDAWDNGNSINMTGTGEPGDFDVDFIPVFQGENPFLDFQGFITGYVRNVNIRGRTSAIN